MVTPFYVGTWLYSDFGEQISNLDTTTGRVNPFIANATSNPETGNSGMLLSVGSSSAGGQIAINRAGKAPYFRRGNNGWSPWDKLMTGTDLQEFFVSESSLFLRNQKNNEMQRILFANASTSIDSGTNVRHTSADDGTITELSIANGKLILIKILPNGTRTSKEVAAL